MTELLLVSLALALSTVIFAVWTNLHRDHRHYHIELKPNCLLTRHPVVFITGPRSVFYFRKYWNAYPEILAEHGYEVFTLRLPWHGPLRKTKLQHFLQQQTSGKKFHFICDPITRIEMQELLAGAPAAASLTTLQSEQVPKPKPFESISLNLAYKLHSLRHSSLALPGGHDLGLSFPTEASRLLKEMQALGEQDFLG